MLGATVQDFVPCAGIGVMRDGKLIAGVIYHDFKPNAGSPTIMASIAAIPGAGWANREILRGLFAYPFGELGVKRLAVVAGVYNVKSHKMNLQMGFTEEGVLRRGLDGKRDAVIYSMLPEECKWLDARKS